MNPYQRETDWHGLYGSSRDDILRDPASVSHPAKMSLRLLSRIIAQMQEWGWLRPGSCLVDPFAGTFSTGITWAALHPDNRACGIELEGHFVAMGRQNQAHAEKRLGRPLALTILRGDSRHVAALLAGDLSTTRALVAKERAALETAWRADWSAVAFQPFGPWGLKASQDAETGELHISREGGYAAAVGKAWVLEKWEDREAVVGSGCVGSPPYGESKIRTFDVAKELRAGGIGTQYRNGNNPGGEAGVGSHGYGADEAQIGNLPDREAVALASPPYADSVNAQAHGIDWTKAGPATGNRKRGEGCKQGETFAAHLAYGASSGQIGALPDACATSPPFEAQRGSYQPTATGPLASQALFDRHAASNAHDGYGENGDGQIGTKQAESYSDACLAVYRGLADAGVRYLCLVVKNPTRQPKGIKFCKCK